MIELFIADRGRGARGVGMMSADARLSWPPILSLASEKPGHVVGNLLFSSMGWPSDEKNRI